MNQIIEHTQTGRIKAAHLADWLLEHGIPAVSSEEVARLLGIDKGNVRQYLASQRRRGYIVSPARGLWVPVPPMERSKGAPEPLSYIDAMMEHLGSEYQVGWLSAASLHGASHQAPQIFQVASSKSIAARDVGSTTLDFKVRDYVKKLPTKRLTRSSGTAIVADPGPTMFMVADDLLYSGGLDNAATVIMELGLENPHALDTVENYQEFFSVSALRRVGWVLDRFESGISTDKLLEFSEVRGGSPSMLSPHSSGIGHVDKRWNLLVNREVEPDL